MAVISAEVASELPRRTERASMGLMPGQFTMPTPRASVASSASGPQPCPQASAHLPQAAALARHQAPHRQYPVGLCRCRQGHHPQTVGLPTPPQAPEQAAAPPAPSGQTRQWSRQRRYRVWSGTAPPWALGCVGR